MSDINLGTAWPLGSTITKRGVNFSVAAPNADCVELLLFQDEDDSNPKEIIKLSKKNKSGDYWHVEIKDLAAGSHYAYRVTNKETASGKNNFPERILLDPCAREISGWKNFKRKSSTKDCQDQSSFLKGVVCERDEFDFTNHPRPRHPWQNTIIYELHVGGFTGSYSSGLNANNQGTFIGIIEKIPYLKDIGITTIELLPVFAFDTSDAPLGLENHWGYSPVNWFTPHQFFVSKESNHSARDQFRKLIAKCHDNGIEVILDVVYNHTTEGNEDGPIISWKGFGEDIFYHKNEQNEFLDVTGCGNTIAANQPIVRQIILESIRCWAIELGVDGFRFDLGISLSRGKDLSPLDSPPIFEEIESDPLLSDLKLISEPWDCGGLYRLADFPAKRITTWNGHFRDDLRKFWKGDKNSTWSLKDRLMGSPAIYKNNISSVQNSLNFITSHDGFTLLDLVSFNKKHNLSNGESNRDGENNNNSWNHGIEGPSTNEDLNAMRSRQQRNLFSGLLLSPGIPMILMGDEVGRSQGGNNNAWCQNSTLGWMIWDKKQCDNDLKFFVKQLIKIRKSLGNFFSPEINPISKPSLNNSENNYWIQWHGVNINSPDWSSWSHTISYSVNESNKGSVAWIGLNAYDQSMKFELPKSTSTWMKVIDTTRISAKDLEAKQMTDQKEIEIESRSLVLILSKDYCEFLI